MYSERERIAHVVRRLGIGANPSLVDQLESVDDAIATLLAVPADPLDAPTIDRPQHWDEVDYDILWKELVPWWLQTMASGAQPLVERLVWFWHDHFAVSGEKVNNSYILWQHHLSVRRLATADFSHLLHAMAVDPAMLWYLDGTENISDAPNENFAREVMELHTMGPGHHTQHDVVNVARACTGWVINEPHWEDGGFTYDAPGWSAVFDSERHDAGTKTALGRTSRFDLGDVMDVLLDQPETRQHVAAKLYRELVGLEPPPATIERLSRVFADFDIMRLVEEIATDPAFVSDAAIRSKIRSPLEKAVGVLQGLPRNPDQSPEAAFWMLDRLHYLPLHPPNPAGFPADVRLLDPARLFGGFELLSLAANADEYDQPIDPLQALGLYDVSLETQRLLDRFPRPGLRLGLAFGSPEFQVV